LIINNSHYTVKTSIQLFGQITSKRTSELLHQESNQRYSRVKW